MHYNTIPNTYGILPFMGNYLSISQECFTAVICPTRSLWAVGVGMKGGWRWATVVGFTQPFSPSATSPFLPVVYITPNDKCVALGLPHYIYSIFNSGYKYYMLLYIYNYI